MIYELSEEQAQALRAWAQIASRGGVSGWGRYFNGAMAVAETMVEAKPQISAKELAENLLADIENGAYDDGVDSLCTTLREVIEPE